VVLLIPCCGVVALFGAGFFWTARSVQEVQTEITKAQNEARMNIERTDQEMRKTKEDFEEMRDGIQKDIEGIKIPDLESSPVPESPALPGSPAGENGK
jgi:hypothetical protein